KTRRVTAIEGWRRDFLADWEARASAMGGFLGHFRLASRRKTHFVGRPQQLWQANEVVGDEGEGEDRLDLVEAAHLQLREAADDFAPAEAFLDPFALSHADRVAEAGGDLRRHGRFANLAQLAHRSVDGDVRLDAALLQALDESLGVVVLVRAQARAFRQVFGQARRRLAFGRARRKGRLGADYEAVAVLHQRV